MHDPSTLAFELRLDFLAKPSNLGGHKIGPTVFTIWHNDPEKDGTDDSCGWFMRARHGNKKTLEKIASSFSFDWDRTWKSDGPQGQVYLCGYFTPEGKNVLSPMAITLGLFRLAAFEHFKHNHKRVQRFMNKNLYDILHFAENQTDSLYDLIIRKFGIDERETREDRIMNFASIIYGYILRHDRPWWKHPKFHVWHWEIKVPFFQAIYRWLFQRCSKCRKGFRWREQVCGNWDGNAIWHFSCDRSSKFGIGPSQENQERAESAN